MRPGRSTTSAMRAAIVSDSSALDVRLGAAVAAQEVEELGDEAQEGPVLGARVEHELAKRVLIGDDPRVFFTTSHFKGYPAVLVRLDRISVADLEEVVTEAWLVRAPRRAVKAYLELSP